MRSFFIFCAAALIATPLTAPSLYAGTIERACLKSSRKGVTRASCLCIQQVADAKLTRSDQKQAAKFFKDPQLAQDTRQSSNPSKERFWLRYKEFGQVAAEHCG